MPIKRFADTLYQTGQYAGYMEVLANAFNAQTVAGLMCRHTVNVAWDGKIYDCDFNAALDMGTQPGKYAHKRGTRLDIWDIGTRSKHTLVIRLTANDACRKLGKARGRFYPHRKTLLWMYRWLRFELRWCFGLICILQFMDLLFEIIHKLRDLVA